MSEKNAGPVIRVMRRPAEIPPRMSLCMRLKSRKKLGDTREGAEKAKTRRFTQRRKGEITQREQREIVKRQRFYNLFTTL